MATKGMSQRRGLGLLDVASGRVGSLIGDPAGAPARRLPLPAPFLHVGPAPAAAHEAAPAAPPPPSRTQTLPVGVPAPAAHHCRVTDPASGCEREDEPTGTRVGSGPAVGHRSRAHGAHRPRRSPHAHGRPGSRVVVEVGAGAGARAGAEEGPGSHQRRSRPPHHRPHAQHTRRRPSWFQCE